MRRNGNDHHKQRRQNKHSRSKPSHARFPPILFFAGNQKSEAFASGIGYSMSPKYFSKATLFSAQTVSSIVPWLTLRHCAVPDQGWLKVPGSSTVTVA